MKTCSVHDLKKALENADEHTKFIDVRSPEEYKKIHIDGFENVTLTPDLIEKWDKEAVIYVHCLGGGRSKFACSRLNQLGFKNACNVEGGIKAWEAAGYPVVKG